MRTHPKQSTPNPSVQELLSNEPTNKQKTLEEEGQIWRDASHPKQLATLQKTHPNQPDRSRVPPEPRLMISPRSPNVASPYLCRRARCSFEEEDEQRSMFEEDGRLEDGEVDGDGGGERGEKGQEVESDFSGCLMIVFEHRTREEKE